MPRTFTETRTVYQYDELTDKAKSKARDWYLNCSDGDSWWNPVYEDAKMVGVRLSGFDIDRKKIYGCFDDPAKLVAEEIVKNHGSSCATYNTAKCYLESLEAVQGKADEVEDEENLAQLFLDGILQDYLCMLAREYDYVNSQEYVEETIRANEYEFNIDGSKA